MIIPLIGQSQPVPATHYDLDLGLGGPSVGAYSCTNCSIRVPTPVNAKTLPGRAGAKKNRADDLNLLHYAQDYPQMVTQIEWTVPDPMTPEAALFFDGAALHQAPLPESPPDPRRDAAWKTIQDRFAGVFAKPLSLPPYRFVNGSCNMKPGCSVSPRAGVGRLSQEEITYTKAILTDYLDKGWILPSYSRTAARLFFVTKPNGGLRSVLDYRAFNEVLETQYFPPPEWSNIVNQLGDATLYSTFDCAYFFFQNRLRDEDSWLTVFSTCFGQFEWRICPQGLASSPTVAQRPSVESFSPFPASTPT